MNIHLRKFSILIDFQLQRYKDYFIFTITVLQNATKW